MSEEDFFQPIFLVFYIIWEQRRKAYLQNRTGFVDFKQKQLVFSFCRSVGAPRPRGPFLESPDN